MSPPTIEELAKLAVHARREGRLPDAIRNAEEAVALCRNGGDRTTLVRTLMLLGQIERDCEQSEKALEHYEEAVGLLGNEDDPLRYAHTVRHLADLYCELSKLELAEARYNEALAIYRRENGASPGDLANAVRGFAVMKDAAGSTEEARLLWEEACNLYADLGVKEGIAECSARLSE